MAIKKVIFIALGSIVVVVAAAIIYIVLIINPNDYKPEIISQVKLNSGGELIIEGDISWRFFPNIGLTIGNTQINNPEGFPEQPLFQFDNAQLDLALLPLLSKKIEIGLISIKGLNLYMHTRKDGLTNLEAMSQAAEKSTLEEETSAQTSSPLAINDLAIAGIQIVDAKIIIENLATESKQSIDAINFSLGKLQLDKAVSLVFSAAIDSGDISAQIKSTGMIKIANDFKRFDFTELATNISSNGEKISITGKLAATMGKILSLEYELKIGDIDLDKLLPKSAEDSTAAKAQEQAIDLSWMKDFNVKGLLSLASVKASNLTVSNISLPLELKDGQLKLTALKADLYEGDILSNITLDGRKSVATYTMNTVLNNVQALPLIMDLTEKELISGAVNMSIDMTGKGLDDLSIRKNSKGKGQFAFTDGAIHGVNVAELIRTSYAKIKGQTIEKSKAPAQTDFASFTGSFGLDNGLVENSDLSLLSPLLRIAGKGQANIVDETVNYHLTTALVGTLSGQGGEPIEDLKSISIPLKIKGPLAEPKISLDLEDLFKDELKNKAKDKVKDKLKKLFGN